MVVQPAGPVLGVLMVSRVLELKPRSMPKSVSARGRSRRFWAFESVNMTQFNDMIIYAPYADIGRATEVTQRE